MWCRRLRLRAQSTKTSTTQLRTKNNPQTKGTPRRRDRHPTPKQKQNMRPRRNVHPRTLQRNSRNRRIDHPPQRERQTRDGTLIVNVTANAKLATTKGGGKVRWSGGAGAAVDAEDAACCCPGYRAACGTSNVVHRHFAGKTRVRTYARKNNVHLARRNGLISFHTNSISLRRLARFRGHTRTVKGG